MTTKRNMRCSIFAVCIAALMFTASPLPASAQLSQWRSLNPTRDGTTGRVAPAPYLYGAQMLTSSYGWTVGGTYGIFAGAGTYPGKGFALFWDGARWRQTLVPAAAGTLTSVFIVGTNDVWAVGLGPTVIHWDGTAWTTATVAAGATDLFSIFILPGGTDGWAVGRGATANILRWSGTWPTGAWSAFSPSPASSSSKDLRGVFLISPTDGWAVGTAGAIFHWDGAGWMDLSAGSPTANNLYSVFMVSPTDAWAVGAHSTGSPFQSTIIRWNGASWTGPMVAPTSKIDYHSIHMVSGTDGWIAGDVNPTTDEGLLLRWNGVAWTAVRSWVTVGLNDIFMVPGGGDGLGVGDAETILRWNGSKWFAQTSPTDIRLNAVSMVAANDGWAVGDYGTIFSYDGTSWGHYETLPSGVNLNGLDMRATNDGWAVGGSPLSLTVEASGTSTSIPTSSGWSVSSSPDTQTTTSSQAVIWTDKPDYSPGDTPTIYGSGYRSNAEITVKIIRPDGVVNTWSTISSDLGSFATTYTLNGIRGLYTVTATDGTNTATTTFTDGVKAVQCDDGSGPAKVPCTWQTGTLNAPTAYVEGDSLAYSVWIDSLTPGSTGNTLVIEYDFTKQKAGGLIVLGFDFLTHPDSSETATSTRCSGIPGGTSVPDCAGMGSPGATMSIPSDPFTFSTSGVNLPLDGQTVAAREAAYALSHPGTPRQPVIFGGSITAISVPSKIGDPNTAASRSQVTITFTVGSFNANSCASATSCAVNILVGAHIARGNAFDAGWGPDRGASNFPGSSLATTIGGGSLSIQPAGIKASPTIATVLSSASVTVGGSVYDTATLSGATSDAGGTVTYYYYSGGTCSGTGTQVGSPVTVTNGVVPNSALQQFNSVGSFSWKAVYSGDSKNSGATSACESLAVSKANPSIGTLLSSSSITAGSTVTDSATLTGATSNAGGSVTYNVFSGTTCSGTASDSDTVTVANGVVPGSKAFGPFSAGSYRFQAVYSGDANNNGATSECGTEPLSVGANPMTITTLLSQSTISVGGSVTDSATLSGTTLGTAGGTVTYSAFSGSACGGTALDTDTVNVASGVVPNSKSFTFNSAGTFSFLAVYSGDANHNGATSICSTENLVVNKASPTIATVLSSASVTVGGSVYDTATLSGATSDAGGTVTYYYYSGGTCSGTGTQVGSPVTVTNGVVPNSALQQFNSVGSFSWKAVYSGDANNNGATSNCQPMEVTPMPPARFPPVILRWNGAAWKVVTPSGVAVGEDLYAVDFVNATESWTVGSGKAGPATMLKWDGTIWKSVPSGTPSGTILYSINMLSSTDGWAVGCTDPTSGCQTPIIVRWNGLAWSAVTTPSGIYGLADVFMLSPTNGWAVGYGPTAGGQATIIHWDGSQWTRVPGPTVGPGSEPDLKSVHMVSSTDGWAVGFDSKSPGKSLIVHWDGMTWNVVATLPLPPSMAVPLNSVFMTAPLNGWIVSDQGLILKYGPESVPGTTTSFSTVITTQQTTVPVGPAVPGFPIESIFAGLIGGLVALAILRRRRS